MDTTARVVRYRVHGGPVRVDQRLTVFGDGSAELDEHHRTRDPVRIDVDEREIARILELLDAVEPRRRGIGAWFRDRVSAAKPHKFRVEWEGGTITATDPDDPNLAELLALLDDLRVRAVRSQPR